MEKFDLVVIGAGPAGYAAAMRGLDFDKKVCLIERHKVGGAGIFNGALSSKTMWELSSKVAEINETITQSNENRYEIPWKTVQKTIEEAVFERKIQYSTHIKLLQNEDAHTDFTYLRGDASFLNQHEIQVVGEEKTHIVYGENIVIATGSRPRPLPNIQVDDKVILTSDGIEHIDDYPKSLVIVGAGVIGCEYATIFANFGKTKVHIIDRQDRILPFEDEDISQLISNKMESKGVVIHHQASLVRLEKVNDEVEYELSYPDKPNEVIRVEKALLSVGRIPNHETLQLEKAGVLLSKRGVHIGDDDTQTNIPNIYAAGDVSGRIALVNMGEIEGRHAVRRMYSEKCDRISYDNVCTIMFLNPEVASVGLNEQDCVAKNIPVKVVKIDYSLIARSIAMRKPEGFFKLIVSNEKEMKILGMRAVGEHASSAIQAIGLMIKLNMTVDVLTELIHPHPSIVEGVRDCVRMLCNKSIFKTSVFKDKLACYSLIDGIKTPLDRL